MLELADTFSPQQTPGLNVYINYIKFVLSAVQKLLALQYLERHNIMDSVCIVQEPAMWSDLDSD